MSRDLDGWTLTYPFKTEPDMLIAAYVDVDVFTKENIKVYFSREDGALVFKRRTNDSTLIFDIPEDVILALIQNAIKRGVFEIIMS